MAKKSGAFNLKGVISLEDRISKEIAAIEKSISGLINNLGGISAAGAGLSSINIDVQIFGADEAQREVESIGDVAESAEAAVAGLGDTEVTVDTAEAEKDIESIGDTAEEAGGKAEDAFAGAGEALAALGYIKFAGKIIDGFKGAAEEAMEFETAMAKVSAIADESVSLEGLKGEIQGLSDDTNKNVNDLAEAAYQAISASVDTADSVRFAGEATKLAEGGFTESATAVDVLTTAINAYKLEASDASKISDILINTQNLGKTTVDQLAGSMGAVIPLAAAYGVQLEQLATGYVELTRQGIDTAMSGTYLRGMLQELGDSSSEVAQVIKNETGLALADLMEQGYSLGDVLGILGDSVDGNTTAFVELWSNIRASTGALALYNAGAEDFNSVLSSMTTSVGAADAAYAKMTDTTAHAKAGMENGISRLADAIGSDLNPALKGSYEFGDKAFTWMADFVEACPGVTAGLTAVATGGTTLLGITSVLSVGKIKAVASAFSTLGSVLAANPWIWAAGAIVGLGAGLIALASAASEASDPMERLTSSSEKQKQEIEALQSEYDGLCSEGRGLSEEALRLKYEIDDLSASFETNRKTLGDVIAEGEELQSTYDEIIRKYDETVSGIENESTANLALIQHFEDLADSVENAVYKTEEMEAVYNRLKENLNVFGYDDFAAVTADIEGYTKAAKAAAKVQGDKNLKEGLIETGLDYDEQIAKEEAYVKGLELLKKDAEAARKEFNRNFDESEYADITIAGSALISGEAPYNDEIKEYDDLIKAHEENIANLTDEQKQNQAALAALSAQQQTAIESVTDLNGAVETAKEVAGTALADLKTSYNEAYQAAIESIQGQIGLFDKMETGADLSVSQMISNLQSQSDYLSNYTDNLKKLREMGLDEGIALSLSDGSAESAGYADAIVKGGIENINALNDAYTKSMEKQAEWAAYVASCNVDVSSGIEPALTQMYEAIDKMDISEQAKEHAMQAAQEYVAGLSGMELSELDGISDKIKEKLTPTVDETNEAAAAAANTGAAFGDMLTAVMAAGAGLSANTEAMAEDITDTFGNIDLYTPGANIVAGLINGMESKRGALETAAAAMANIVQTAFTEAMEIHSPSKVMYGYGVYTAQGAVLGMESEYGSVEYAGRELGERLELSRADIEALKESGRTYSRNYGGDTSVKVDMSGMNVTINSDDDYESFGRKLSKVVSEAFMASAAGVHR